MTSERVQFGQFVLDPGRYELTCAGKPVHIERIPMDLLMLLVREGARLVSRDEIIERLWGKGIHFDTDNSINTAIRKIRRALGEDPANPQYVETVLGKGYRFKGVAQVLRPVRAEGEGPRIILAVLPFENLSGDPSQEYFSDGLTEETIMRLGQLSPHRLGVIARTSSMAYKRTDKSVARIGQELGAEYVLEGSVRREADRVRVTAQLIRVKDQIHLWAQNYDRQLPGILDIQGEIGAAIAEQVAITSEGESKRGAGQPDPEALDQYLRGRFHYARSNLVDLQKAVGYFQKATELDSAYTLAYSGLADALVILPISGDRAPMEVFPRAKKAIARALELDPDSAEAHTADATSKFWFDWDFPGAEAAARRAIELNENYSLAHLYLAHVLSNTGRHEEAMATIQQASVLDPLSLITGAMRGQFLYHARRDAEAVEQFNATLSMEPRFWVGQICFAKVLERIGRYEEALEACDAAFEFSGGNSEALSLAGYIHAVTGNRAKAEENIAKMLEGKKQRYVPSYNLALIFAGLQEEEPVLDWLGHALEERDVHMTFLRDHKWDGMRGHPSFQQILLRAGFRSS